MRINARSNSIRPSSDEQLEWKRNEIAQQYNVESHRAGEQSE